MQPALPNGYHFVYGTDISPDDVMALRQSVGWDGLDQESWDKCIRSSIAVVGIQDASGPLVGVSFIAGNTRHAVLCDMVVAPDHQKRGLGTALLYERVRLSDELGILYLYTDLAQTNNIRAEYLSLGFNGTGGGLFRVLA
ncbi:MAG: N-acetyltransferase [Candidatus Saccharibacteria bacterium]|nr:N-acetyltransferase [Candidatus Saccharibacteria bacterium]